MRRETSDDQGYDGLKMQTYGEPGRRGPQAVGRQRYADSGHVYDWDDCIFQVTDLILFRVKADEKRVTYFCTMESVNTCDTIICPCVKFSTLSNMASR